MINKNLYLVENLFDKSKIQKVKTRDGYGKGLVEAGEKNPNVVVLCADLSESTRSLWFEKKFPEWKREAYVPGDELWHLASHAAHDQDHAKAFEQALMQSVQDDSEADRVIMGAFQGKHYWDTFWKQLNTSMNGEK